MKVCWCVYSLALFFFYFIYLFIFHLALTKNINYFEHFLNFNLCPIEYTVVSSSSPVIYPWVSNSLLIYHVLNVSEYSKRTTNKQIHLPWESCDRLISSLSSLSIIRDL